MSAFGKYNPRAVVAVAPKKDTPTDDMPTSSPAAAAGPSDKFELLYRRPPPGLVSPPIGTPPGYTTRTTSREELRRVPGDMTLGKPSAAAYVASAERDRYRSIKGEKGDLKARFGGRSRRRRHVGGGVYLDNGLPFGSANPQELAAGKMLRGGRRTRKVRIPIKHTGDLTNLGYSMTKKARTRHGALKKAVKKFGRATVSRKLNALAIFNKRRHPATARKARADRKYAMKV